MWLVWSFVFGIVNEQCSVIEKTKKYITDKTVFLDGSGDIDEV